MLYFDEADELVNVEHPAAATASASALNNQNNKSTNNNKQLQKQNSLLIQRPDGYIVDLML